MRIVLRRRRIAVGSIAAVLVLLGSARVASGGGRSASPPARGRQWFEAAAAMKRLAEARGDQPYGAVVVLDDRIVGEAPSRVVERADPTAHAEREAIRDAQRRLSRADLAGSILYSTSRPCAACEAAAAAAGVARMVYGEALHDAGAPGR